MQDLSENAIKTVIIGSVPEKAKELNQMWEDYEIQAHLADDKEGFTLEAMPAFTLIKFDHKTMSQLWLVGEVAKLSYAFFYPRLRYAIDNEQRVDFNHIIQKNNFSQEIIEVFNQMEEMRNADSMDNITWLNYIPSPEQGKITNSDLDSMAFDLKCIFAGFCFLHEIRHIQLKGETLNPNDEELECDKYAVNYLLDEVKKYSTTHDYPYEIVKMKRALGIALATILFLTNTPNHQWQGTETHPNVFDRIKRIWHLLKLDKYSFLWLYLAFSLLSFIASKGKITIKSTPINNFKDYCFYLLDAIERAQI